MTFFSFFLVSLFNICLDSCEHVFIFLFLSSLCPDLSVVWRNPVLLAKKRSREDASASWNRLFNPLLSLALPVTASFSHPSDPNFDPTRNKRPGHDQCLLVSWSSTVSEGDWSSMGERFENFLHLSIRRARVRCYWDDNPAHTFPHRMYASLASFSCKFISRCKGRPPEWYSELHCCKIGNKCFGLDCTGV